MRYVLIFHVPAGNDRDIVGNPLPEGPVELLPSDIAHFHSGNRTLTINAVTAGYLAAIIRDRADEVPPPEPT